MNNNFNIKTVVVILIVSLILALIYNYFSEDGIKFIREPLIVHNVDVITNEDTTKGLKGLNLAHVISLQNQNAAIFVDARDQWDFAEGHIIGALSIPEFSFSPDNKVLESIKKESLIIVYCDGDDCDTSKRLTNELLKIGYKNSYVFWGGIKEWTDANLPLEKGVNNE